MCDSNFELKIEKLRFVGYPLSIARRRLNGNAIGWTSSSSLRWPKGRQLLSDSVKAGVTPTSGDENSSRIHSSVDLNAADCYSTADDDSLQMILFNVVFVLKVIDLSRYRGACFYAD